MTTPDVFTFHTPDALEAMPLAEVEALWELVPTERQRMYRAIYDRTRRYEGASGSDAQEAGMVEQLLERYRTRALVPVGAYWVPTPSPIQESAKADVTYTPAEPVNSSQKSRKPSPVILLIGVLVRCFLAFYCCAADWLNRGVSEAGRSRAR